MRSAAKKAADKRYNDKTYGKCNASIRRDVLDRFGAACKVAGRSQASVVTEAMEDFSEEVEKRGAVK